MTEARIVGGLPEWVHVNDVIRGRPGDPSCQPRTRLFAEPATRMAGSGRQKGITRMRYRTALLSLCVAVAGCKSPFSHNLPPAVQLAHPGPGVGGPGPGVLVYGNPGSDVQLQSSQVHFVGPEGMMVAWDATGSGMFDSEPLVCPGRFNFGQASLYRLKLSNIPGPDRVGAELYPTLEVAPPMPRTEAYLAHNAIPFQITDEDFDQVLSGNFVTKVIYLPDAEFQELALAGVETLVSTRLDPGVDPIVEADRRGSILAIIRLGNKDLEVPGVDGFAGGGGMMAGGGGYCPPGGGGAFAGDLPGNVSGVTTAQYGMPMTGTPIGLPGPPHIPLGVPAGLQKQTIRNHTFTKIPQPVEHTRIHVKQNPAMSYPVPARTAYIQENARTNWGRRPPGTRAGALNPEDCPPQ